MNSRDFFSIQILFLSGNYVMAFLSCVGITNAECIHSDLKFFCMCIQKRRPGNLEFFFGAKKKKSKMAIFCIVCKIGIEDKINFFGDFFSGWMIYWFLPSHWKIGSTCGEKPNWHSDQCPWTWWARKSADSEHQIEPPKYKREKKESNEKELSSLALNSSRQKKTNLAFLAHF